VLKNIAKVGQKLGS